MFERLKAAAREKLQRAVAEVVEDEHARSQQSRHDLQAEVLAAIDRLGGTCTTSPSGSATWVRASTR